MNATKNVYTLEVKGLPPADKFDKGHLLSFFQSFGPVAEVDFIGTGADRKGKVAFQTRDGAVLALQIIDTRVSFEGCDSPLEVQWEPIASTEVEAEEDCDGAFSFEPDDDVGGAVASQSLTGEWNTVHFSFYEPMSHIMIFYFRST